MDSFVSHLFYFFHFLQLFLIVVLNYWPPLRRKKQRDCRSQAIYLFPVASSILENLCTMDIISLINTSLYIRNHILQSHFARLRELVVLKDEGYHQNFDIGDELID